MRYKVTITIERDVEAKSPDDAINEAWHWAWDDGGASNLPQGTDARVVPVHGPEEEVVL